MRHLVQGYQISLIVMTNKLCFQWPLCICIPSCRHNDMSVAVTDNKIHSVTLYYTVTVGTPLTFVLWLCQGFGCASLMQTAQLGSCVCYCGRTLVFCCWNLMYVVRIGLVRFEVHMCCLCQCQICMLLQKFLNFSVSHLFAPKFCVSVQLLKCTKPMGPNSFVFQ